MLQGQGDRQKINRRIKAIGRQMSAGQGEQKQNVKRNPKKGKSKFLVNAMLYFLNVSKLLTQLCKVHS